METEVKVFLELVRTALKEEIYQEKITNEQEIYLLARENSLSGLIFPSLNPELIDAKLYKSFQKDFYEFLTKDAKQNAVINSLSEMFSEIPYILLKGSFLKHLYPSSYMRSMGDIDILIKPEYLPKVHEILAANNFRNWQNSPDHDCFHNGKGVLLEIHPKLMAEVDSKYDYLFENPWDWAVQKEGSRYEFQPEYHLIYLLYHMAKHLTGSGIGFRTILDLCVFAHKEEIDWRKVEELLQKAELEKFAKTMFWLGREYFGTDNFPLLGGFEPEAGVLEIFTDYLVRSGIHGLGSDFNPFVSRMVKESRSSNDLHKGRRQTLFRIIFPKVSVLKASYSYLNRHIWLLPWAWLSRLFRLAFKQRKSSIMKIKKLKIKDDALIEHRDLIEKIGL
ncbi:MAG: nucleotidyltransferase family protein [Acholeplasmataceae bacterium]|nr:nucleotidyltransferase family protein [Acholeplasmataceae bacterium]